MLVVILLMVLMLLCGCKQREGNTTPSPVGKAAWTAEIGLGGWIAEAHDSNAGAHGGAPGQWIPFGTATVESIPRLVEMLDDPDVDVRANAARALGRLGPEARPAVPHLIAGLTEIKWRVSSYSAEALLSIYPAAALDETARLIALLDSEDEMQRAGAVRGLGSIGPVPLPPSLADALDRIPADVLTHFPRNVPRMVPQGELDSQSPPLLRLDPRSRAALSALHSALRDPSPAVRKQAVLAVSKFGRYGGEAALTAAELLSDPDADVRGMAVAVAPELSFESASKTQQLIDLLDDEDSVIRFNAVNALASQVPLSDELIPHLLSRIEAHDWSLEGRSPTGAAYLALTRYGPRVAHLVPEMTEHVATVSSQHFALQVLAAIGPAADSAIPEVIEVVLAEHSVTDPSARQYTPGPAWTSAVLTLAKLDPVGDRVWPTLVEAARNHPDEATRVFAIQALSELSSDDPQLTAAMLELMAEEQYGGGLLPALVRRLDDRGVLLVIVEQLAGPPAPAAVLLIHLTDQQLRGTPQGDSLAELLEVHSHAPASKIALSALIDDPQRRVELLLDALDADDPRFKALACEQLAQLGPLATAAVPKVEELLADNALACFAAAALSQIDPAALGPHTAALTRLLPNLDDPWRARLVLALSEAGPAARAALPYLDVLTYSHNQDVAVAATVALYRIAAD